MQMNAPTSRAREATAILDDLRRVVRALRESSREAEQRLGVSGAQLFVLHTLKSAPSLSLNELAARTRTHQSTVSVVVRRLVERGLVRRGTSSLDGRRLELSLTRAGQQVLKRSPLAAQERLIHGIDRLDARTRRSLERGLHALVEAMELDDGAPQMFFEDDAESPASRRRARHVAS
jgi:DNA-binding MarR family transcriptional regulator